ncbi:hypothetical protein B2J93_699 [Marssonina coronariae]|uniref:Uncharacterized protein n=1 Tax=Diplocarpon coronariae TaxID=2795749 RepID=A0A218Z093_9HELO|nr:hypothetical protein B2J93_699 [Marssonina coronariae]
MSAAAGRFAIISPGASDRQQQLLPGLHVACPAPMWRSPGSRCSRAGGPSGPRDSPRVGVLAAAAAARPAASSPCPHAAYPTSQQILRVRSSAEDRRRARDPSKARSRLSPSANTSGAPRRPGRGFSASPATIATPTGPSVASQRKPFSMLCVGTGQDVRARPDMEMLRCSELTPLNRLSISPVLGWLGHRQVYPSVVPARAPRAMIARPVSS